MEHDQGTEAANIIKEGNKELFLEGKAKIYTKYIEKNQNGEIIQNGVFYNPVQIFNRDTTLVAMQTYINLLKQQKKDKFDGVNIIDALSASGLRTIRFLKQLQDIKIVYANDISQASHKLMKDNFKLNELDESKLKMTLQDANLLLQTEKKNITFDIIDLDPYGSVVPFLEAAVEGIKDGGLLCITCTDTKVTCGPDISKCYYYYGTTRAKVHHFNQNAIRIVLYTISASASRHCKFIQPLFSFQADFYLRVYVRVRRGKRQCSQSATKIGNVYNCNSCGNYQYQTLFHEKNNKQSHYVPSKISISSNICSICSQPYYLNGPIWLANINDNNFVKSMMEQMEKQNKKLQIRTQKKIYGTLHAILQQKQLSNIPLGFNFDKMCKNAKASTPNRKILIAAAESLGYKIVPSYVSPGLYKTNANINVIYDIIKSWKLKDAGEQKYLLNVKQQFSINLLKKQIIQKPDFQYKSETQENNVPRFISLGKGLGPKGKPQRKVIEQQKN